MSFLAIECATAACSAALFVDGKLMEGRYEVIGRGHAERLVPMIAELPGKGRADEIRVSLGPGSFTGARIGLSAARALGLAWGSTLLGYPTLALVAAMAHAKQGCAITVCMTGGHGEWFVQNFDAEGRALDELVSLAPAQAVLRAINEVVAGSEAEALVALRGSGTALAMLPDAHEAHLLQADVLTRSLTPLYGRAPDAQLPKPRA